MKNKFRKTNCKTNRKPNRKTNRKIGGEGNSLNPVSLKHRIKPSNKTRNKTIKNIFNDLSKGFRSSLRNQIVPISLDEQVSPRLSLNSVSLGEHFSPRRSSRDKTMRKMFSHPNKIQPEMKITDNPLFFYKTT